MIIYKRIEKIFIFLGKLWHMQDCIYERRSVRLRIEPKVVPPKKWFKKRQGLVKQRREEEED